MSNLSVFKSDNGVEIIIDQRTGEGFCTVSGYARMSGKGKGAISRRLKGVASSTIKTGEIFTPGGLQGVLLITEDLITDWIVDDNPMVAKQLLKAGVRIYLHNLAGYKIRSEAVQPQPPQTSAEMFLMVATQMVEQERKTKELESRVNQIETDREEARASLDEVIPPSVEVQELTTRARVCRLVNDYVAATLIPYQEVWQRLYREFKDRYHLDLRQRAKNVQAATGRRVAAIDVCERLGKIEELYAVAFELLKA